MAPPESRPDTAGDNALVTVAGRDIGAFGAHALAGPGAAVAVIGAGRRPCPARLFARHPWLWRRRAAGMIGLPRPVNIRLG
jgi:NAD(P)-dependent dehydrogenase (short-subunit alcohol dehydrogenase family)